MAADVATSLASWSATAASNSPSGSTAISTNLDDNLRQIQAVVRTLAAADTIASATTCDLGTKESAFLTISGTTTITGLGTISAGIYKWVIFSGALTLTHNAGSLILPGGANITTAAGDTALMLSLGAGNWRCIAYAKASGYPVATGVTLDSIADAAANGAIAAGAYAQDWTWSFTSAVQYGLALAGSSTAGTSAGPYLLKVTSTNAACLPIKVTYNGVDMINIDNNGGLSLLSAYANQYGLNVTGATNAGGVGGGVRVAGGVGSTTGGAVTIIGGASSSGGTRYAGGDVRIRGGVVGGSSGNVGGASVSLYSETGGGTGVPGDINLFAGNDIRPSARARGSDRHLEVVGAAPTVSAGGGTGVAIVGADQAFVVTAGSGSPTSVTVDFNTTWAAVPVVTATSSQSGLVLHVATVSTTQVQISSSAAMSSGTKIYVQCMGYANS